MGYIEFILGSHQCTVDAGTCDHDVTTQVLSLELTSCNFANDIICLEVAYNAHALEQHIKQTTF